MTSENLDTIRTYLTASGEFDWKIAGRCVGPGYVWIDHGTGVVARSPAELQEALEDASAYTSARYDIEQAFEATNGAIIVQGVQTCTIAGTWRSMEATGQVVSFPFCSIFRFDDDGLIVHEEQYYDMYSVRRQLGY
jgi:predicted ester cyclase